MSIFKPNLFDLAHAFDNMADAATKGAKLLRQHEGPIDDALLEDLRKQTDKMGKFAKTWTRWQEQQEKAVGLR